MFGIKLCPKCRKPMVSDGYVYEIVNTLFGGKKRIKKKQWRCESCNYYENE
jgi:CRISPR/Cas system-associated exonuclease Cas4 (RecB family)